MYHSTFAEEKSAFYPTKGLSSGQIQRMFLTEAVVIGLMGGLLGVIGGLILNQYYSGAVNLNSLFTSQLFSPEIAVVHRYLRCNFGAYSQCFSPLAGLPEFLLSRHYEMTCRQDKSHRKIFPIIALILGTYKIVIYALGLNINTLLSQLVLWRKHVPYGILALPLSIFDAILTFFGPFLFFWGFT